MTQNFDLINVSQIVSDFIKTEEKNEKRSQNEALSLTTMLNQMMQVLANAKAGGDADGSDGASLVASKGSSTVAKLKLPEMNPFNGNHAPSSLQLGELLAMLAGKLSQLKEKVDSSNNANYQNSLQMQNAEIAEENAIYQKAEKVYQELQEFEQTFQQMWAYMMSQHITGNFASLEAYMIRLLNAYYGWNLSPTAFSNCATESSFFQAVETYMYGSSLQTMWETLSGGSNPAISNILKMLESGEISAAEAQKLLEGILAQLFQLLSLLSKATSGGSDSEGPSNALLSQIMSQMTGMVSQLQGTMAKFNGNQATNQTDINQAFIKQAQANLQSAVNQYNKIVKEEHDRSFWDSLLDAISIVVSCIVSIIACCFGQVEIAAITMAFLVMQKTGVMDKLTEGLTDLFEKMGIPSTIAKVLSDALIIAAAIIATGGVAGQSAVTTVTEQTAEVIASQTEAVVNAVVDTVSQVVAESSQVATQEAETASASIIKKVFQKLIEKFASYGLKINMQILVGVQTAMSTNVTQNMALAIASATHMSESEKNKFVMAMGIVSSVFALALGGLSMSGMSANIQRTTKVAEMISKLLGPSALKVLGLGVGTVTGIGQGVSQSELAAIDFRLANTQEEVQTNEAVAHLFQSYEKLVNQKMQSSTQFYTSALKQEGEIQSQVFREVVAGEVAFAQLLAQGV